MTIKYYWDLEQGTDEWLEARRGILTASEMKLILTPTLKVANNEKSRTHLYELAAQSISKFVEPSYISDDMMRGTIDEIDALQIYNVKYGEVTRCGFITNSSFGYTLGFSPDGLIGDDGFVECKSRRQKYQIKTIADNEMPDEYMMQVQTGFKVTGRKWCDFISYCGGLPMYVKHIYPIQKYQDAISDACDIFHEELLQLKAQYGEQLVKNKKNLTPTKRKIYEDMEIR